MFFKLFLVLTCAIQYSLSAKILAVFPVPSISHQSVFRVLMLELARRGHQVTVITTDPIPNPPDNYTQIDVHDISYNAWNKEKYADHGVKSMTHEQSLYLMFPIIVSIFEAQINEESIQDILKRPNDFDVILLETVFPLAFGFAHVMKAPIIGISSLFCMTTTHLAMGNPLHPIIYPDLFRTKLKDINLYDKVSTVVMYLRLYFFNDVIKDSQKIMAKYFGEDVPTIDVLENKFDLVISNYYSLIPGIRPLVPAFINVGGLNFQSAKPLPQELQDYIDDSKEGVIYFSFGTNVFSKDLPKEKIDLFLDVFSTLPYKVIWKYEDDNLTNMPQNVMIRKWLPQNDILAHPKVKLFITQGGQQSMEEAIQNGVPLLGMPFIADQIFNVERMQVLNIGLRLNIGTLTRDQLKGAINELIQNPSYKGNITRLRDLINDEPMGGLEKAVWWIEYVIRHKGAKHLRSPSADINWMDYFMIDVLAVILIGFLTLIAVIVIGLSYIYRLLINLYISLSTKTVSQVSKKHKTA